MKKNKKNIILIICGIAIGFFNGLFGGGGGMVCVPTLKKFVKLPQKKAHATTTFIMLPISIASMIIYITSNNFVFFDYVWIILGSVLGGLIGAKILNIANNKIVAIIFAILMLVGGIRLLF